ARRTPDEGGAQQVAAMLVSSRLPGSRLPGSRLPGSELPVEDSDDDDTSRLTPYPPNGMASSRREARRTSAANALWLAPGSTSVNSAVRSSATPDWADLAGARIPVHSAPAARG